MKVVTSPQAKSQIKWSAFTLCRCTSHTVWAFSNNYTFCQKRETNLSPNLSLSNSPPFRSIYSFSPLSTSPTLSLSHSLYTPFPLYPHPLALSLSLHSFSSLPPPALSLSLPHPPYLSTYPSLSLSLPTPCPLSPLPTTLSLSHISPPFLPAFTLTQ